jgi:hypothetical protein
MSQSMRDIRRETHMRRQKELLTIKWAPVILEMMNRKRFNIQLIERSLWRTWFRPAKDYSADAAGIYRIRFTLTAKHLDPAELGLTKEEFDILNSDDVPMVEPVRVIYDIRNLEYKMPLIVDDRRYNLLPADILRLALAKKRIEDVRFIQNMEYDRALAIDRRAASSNKNS